jgi:hypothetical protein
VYRRGDGRGGGVRERELIVEIADWKERLAIYDKLVDLCPRFERKGKTMPCTSANGHMFSLLNKDAELGIRLSKESGERFKAEHNTTIFKSYGAVIRRYVLISDAMLDDLETLATYLDEAYDYVMSREPK